MGDPKRMFVDGVGSLYRMKEYNGTWCENVSVIITHLSIYVFFFNNCESVT